MMGVVVGSALGGLLGKKLKRCCWVFKSEGAETSNSWDVTTIKAPSPSSTNDMGVYGLLGTYDWGPLRGLHAVSVYKNLSYKTRR